MTHTLPPNIPNDRAVVPHGDGFIVILKQEASQGTRCFRAFYANRDVLVPIGQTANQQGWEHNTTLPNFCLHTDGNHLYLTTFADASIPKPLPPAYYQITPQGIRPVNPPQRKIIAVPRKDTATNKGLTATLSRTELEVN